MPAGRSGIGHTPSRLYVYYYLALFVVDGLAGVYRPAFISGGDDSTSEVSLPTGPVSVLSETIWCRRSVTSVNMNGFEYDEK